MGPAQNVFRFRTCLHSVLHENVFLHEFNEREASLVEVNPEGGDVVDDFRNVDFGLFLYGLQQWSYPVVQSSNNLWEELQNFPRNSLTVTIEF